MGSFVRAAENAYAIGAAVVAGLTGAPMAVAHGLLLASMTALGASSAMHRIDGFVFVEQGCRFVSPALVGDTITPRLTVEKIWQEGQRRFVRITTSLTNQRGETVLEGFHVYRMLPSERRAST